MTIEQTAFYGLMFVCGLVIMHEWGRYRRQVAVRSRSAVVAWCLSVVAVAIFYFRGTLPDNATVVGVMLGIWAVAALVGSGKRNANEVKEKIGNASQPRPGPADVARDGCHVICSHCRREFRKKGNVGDAETLGVECKQCESFHCATCVTKIVGKSFGRRKVSCACGRASAETDEEGQVTLDNFDERVVYWQP